MNYKKLNEEVNVPKNRAQEEINRNKLKKESKSNLKRYSEFCDEDDDFSFDSFERIKKKF